MERHLNLCSVMNKRNTGGLRTSSIEWQLSAMPSWMIASSTLTRCGKDEETDLAEQVKYYSAESTGLAEIEGFYGTTKHQNSTKVHKTMIHNMAVEHIEDITWDELRGATDRDNKMQNLANEITTGSVQSINQLLIEDWQKPRIGKTGCTMAVEDLTVIEGVILTNNRPWVPLSLQARYLELLHMGHKGTDIMFKKRLCILAQHDCGCGPVQI